MPNSCDSEKHCYSVILISPYAGSMRKYATLRLIYSNAKISYPQAKTKNIDIDIPGPSQ